MGRRTEPAPRRRRGGQKNRTGAATATRGDSTKSMYLSTLKEVLDHAVLAGLLFNNPVTLIPRGDRPSAQTRNGGRLLHEEEIERILAVAPRRMLFELALGSGLRLGEMLGLCWEDVDLGEKPSVTVSKQWTRKGEFGPPKTKGSYGTVFLPHWVAAKLKAYRVETATITGRIFPITHGAANGSLQTVRRRSKINVSWHDFRHTFGSLLFAAGVNPKVVQRQMRHDNLETTMRTYMHLIDERHEEDQVRQALAR
jgi:integrase